MANRFEELADRRQRLEALEQVAFERPNQDAPPRVDHIAVAISHLQRPMDALEIGQPGVADGMYDDTREDFRRHDFAGRGAVEDEVAAFLGRARYERTPAATGSRNGSRSNSIQTAEGEINVAMPQVRGTVERFVSRIIPDVRSVVRTRPLEALIIGAYVRGLYDRHIESLLDEAGSS